MTNVEGGADMRGQQRRDDGWDEGGRDGQDGQRDPRSGGVPEVWNDRGSDWPAANGYQSGGTGYQSGGTGYQRPAAQAVFPTGSYPGQGASGQGTAGPGHGSAGYAGSGSGYPGTGYDAPGYGNSQYGTSQYGTSQYGGSAYGSAGYGERGYDAAGYSGSPGYGGSPTYGSGSAYDATANGQTLGSAYQGSVGISGPGHGNREFSDPTTVTTQYGGMPSAQEPQLGIPEFGETDRVASADGNSAGTPRPYGRLSIFTLIDDKAAEFDRLAERAAEGVRTTEPDTLVYVIHVVPKAPMQRIIYEIYRDRAAFESHERQPHIQRFAADRRACVLATNIIDLRLKYAKVAALATSQAPQEPQPAQETQLDWVPRALTPGAHAYASRGGSGYGGYTGTGTGGGYTGTGTGGYGYGGGADAGSGPARPADPASGQYSTIGTGQYPEHGRHAEGSASRQSESDPWGQRNGGW